MSFRWVMSAATKWRYHHFIFYYALFIRSEARCQTGMSRCQWTANPLQKSILDTQKLLKLLYMENKKGSQRKDVLIQPFNIYISINNLQKRIIVQEHDLLSTGGTAAARDSLLSSQNIMLLVPICLSFPHFWYPVNGPVLWSLTWEQKPTKLTE